MAEPTMGIVMAVSLILEITYIELGLADRERLPHAK